MPSNLGVFLNGFFMNISNPKAIIFILALIPQFVDPTHSIIEQYLIMGITMTIINTLVMIAYALIASKAINPIKRKNILIHINCVFGLCFAAMARFVRI